MYLGARACLLRGLDNSAYVLAHAALERYLKGLLRLHDPVSFSIAELRSTRFGHDLVALLGAVRVFHPFLDTDRLRKDCEILTKESQKGRYLVTADVAVLKSDAYVDELLNFIRAGRVDWAISEVRNEALESVPAPNRSALLLAEVAQDDLFHWRDLIAKDNPAFESFKGL